MDTSPKKIHSTHTKRCSKSSVTGEMQVRTTKQYRLTPTKMTMIYKKRKTGRKRDRERGRGRRRSFSANRLLFGHSPWDLVPNFVTVLSTRANAAGQAPMY